MKNFLRLFLITALFLSCNSVVGFQSDSVEPSHQIWDELLAKHVDDEGHVNYKGFIASMDSLERYLELLSAQPANSNWPEEAQLAYWINAYNAFTVKLIVDNYPLKSIRDLHPTIYIPMVRTVWHKKFFKIGGKDMNLDTIEHEILRKQFNEPRIHFAIVCASQSCPALLNEAYKSIRLSDQLKQQTIAFLGDPTRNKIQTNRVELSKIFSWFKGDFTKSGTLIDFLNSYSRVQISEDADVEFLDYDWSLNE